MTPSSSTRSPSDEGFREHPLVIRKAEPADLPAIIALFADDALGGHGDTLDPDARPAYEAAYAEIEASPTDHLFVAEFEGGVVGTFQVMFSRALPHRGRLRATLEAVQVAASLRGRRIGEAMVAHAVYFARAQGAAVLQLTSNKRRTDAHRFYERLGFEKSHEGFKLDLV
ncbi:MAG: GNAT family N-acetyltransferase [Ancalomicrobiaceae bacterium]|nr:GNAT family N-acetyltransferase [Ancalomicrobiaceae bacterium]